MKKTILTLILIATAQSYCWAGDGSRGGGSLVSMTEATKISVARWWNENELRIQEANRANIFLKRQDHEKHRLLGRIKIIAIKLDKLTRLGFQYQDAKKLNLFLGYDAFIEQSERIIDFGFRLVPQILTENGKVARDKHNNKLKYYSIPFRNGEGGILLLSKEVLDSESRADIEVDGHRLSYSSLEDALITHEMARHLNLDDEDYVVTKVLPYQAVLYAIRMSTKPQ